MLVRKVHESGHIDQVRNDSQSERAFDCFLATIWRLKRSAMGRMPPASRAVDQPCRPAQPRADRPQPLHHRRPRQRCDLGQWVGIGRCRPNENGSEGHQYVERTISKRLASGKSAQARWPARQRLGARLQVMLPTPYAPTNRPPPSSLPNPKPRLAQANAQFNFHVHGGLILHGVVGLVQIG